MSDKKQKYFDGPRLIGIQKERLGTPKAAFAVWRDIADDVLRDKHHKPSVRRATALLEWLHHSHQIGNSHLLAILKHNIQYVLIWERLHLQFECAGTHSRDYTVRYWRFILVYLCVYFENRRIFSPAQCPPLLQGESPEYWRVGAQGAYPRSGNDVVAKDYQRALMRDAEFRRLVLSIAVRVESEHWQYIFPSRARGKKFGVFGIKPKCLAIDGVVAKEFTLRSGVTKKMNLRLIKEITLNEELRSTLNRLCESWCLDGIEVYRMERWITSLFRRL